MRNFINEIKQGLFSKGSFIRNISVFTSGSFLAYFIGFLFTPIIARIYTPEDYGKFGLFSTVLALVIAISTINYPDALILPKNNKSFFNLSRLIVFFGLCFAVLFTIILVLFGNSFSAYYELENLNIYFFLIPPLLILNTVQLLADNYNIRNKDFKLNAKAKILSVAFGKGFVASLGYFLGSTVYGLISGEIVIRLINTMGLLRKNLLGFLARTFTSFSKHELIKIAIEYKNYPMYIFPTTLLIQGSIHLPVFVIGKLYSAENLGYYTLALGLLGIPIQVIGFSMGKVFLQKANETVVTSGMKELEKQLIHLFYAVTIIAAAGYSIIFGFGEEIFSIVAGANWRKSGELASLLSFALAYQLIATVIAPSFRVLRKEKLLFSANLIGSVTFIVIISVGVILNVELYGFIILLSAGIIVRYLILIVMALSLFDYKTLKHLIFAASITVMFFFLSSLISNLFN